MYTNKQDHMGLFWPGTRPGQATRRKAGEKRDSIGTIGGTDTIDERDPEISPHLLEQGE